MMNEHDGNQQNRASPFGGDYLMELIKSVGGDSQKPVSADESTSTAAASSTTSPFPAADLVSSLLSNPELISKLPTILSIVRPL